MQLQEHIDRFVYIPKCIYDEEVRYGQETDAKTRQQVDLDAPRSILRVDGERVFYLPHNIDTSMARYCSQTVMGMPVELLSRCGLVAECSKPKPLRIDVWGHVVFVTKRLRILQDDEWYPVEVQITVDMTDPCVLMKISLQKNKFNTEREKSFDIEDRWTDLRP